MARIRSVHPSLFTDEAWVSCSPVARLFYIGLWTDADDQGLFEWKPLQLKMRLLPGDTADAGDLLAELEAAGLVAWFDHVGKRYGAIKQFRRYQRPKKPNSVHFMPPEWRTFVGLTVGSSEPEADKPPPVPHQFPTSGEKSPQMEDVGEEVGEEKEDKSSVKEKSFTAQADFSDPDGMSWNMARSVLQAQGGMTEKAAGTLFGRLLSQNGLDPRDMLPAISAAMVNGTRDPQGYLTKAAQAVAKRRAPAPKVVGFV